jgi:hypothetical protein
MTEVLFSQQTLYIYFGVAALIGLITGSILHFSSSVLNKILNLQTPPGAKGRTAASVRAAREKKKVEDAWQAPTAVGIVRGRLVIDGSSKRYPEYVEKDRGKRSPGQGLLSQTILEEDDDSDDAF